MGGHDMVNEKEVVNKFGGTWRVDMTWSQERVVNKFGGT